MSVMPITVSSYVSLHFENFIKKIMDWVQAEQIQFVCHYILIEHRTLYLGMREKLNDFTNIV
jgi:hypothetical protein